MMENFEKCLVFGNKADLGRRRLRKDGAPEPNCVLCGGVVGWELADAFKRQMIVSRCYSAFRLHAGLV